MCGIVGYIGDEPCTPLIIDALRKLEYRGYDSAGVAVLGKGGMTVVRAKGKLGNLEKLTRAEPPEGTCGIGHTRWATHGRPTDENAHPHAYNGVAVVHNGIIENHLELKTRLAAAGHVFSSETDTEIFAHLISDAAVGGASLPEAVRRALPLVRGTYALAVISDRDPGVIVAAKNASPLVVGLGQGANYLASDVPALLEHTRDVIFLEEGEMALIARDGVQLQRLDGTPFTRAARHIDWTPAMAEKGGHKHFMHKEILEQPRALTDTIRGRASLEAGDAWLDEVHVDAALAKGFERIQIVACGTSYHAGLIGKFMLEHLARIHCEVDLASEFRYRDPMVSERTYAIAVSQSGETADTLAAMREAQRRGARALTICNVLGSAIPREAQDVVYTRAGPEIGVASTKAFTTQLAAFFLLAVRLGRLRGTLTRDEARLHLNALGMIPSWLEETLRTEEAVRQVARELGTPRTVLYLGRGPQWPVALEGALKMKEISYVHAEGYAAGEMKHGPIALLEEGTPVVVLANHNDDSVYEKTLGNIHEAKARGARVIAVANVGDEQVGQLADRVLYVPGAPALLAPMLTVLPLQLLSYHVADQKGLDVDQPRNLAKSVTVE